jgi:hypothetical protein
VFVSAPVARWFGVAGAMVLAASPSLAGRSRLRGPDHGMTFVKYFALALHVPTKSRAKLLRGILDFKLMEQDAVSKLHFHRTTRRLIDPKHRSRR